MNLGKFSRQFGIRLSMAPKAAARLPKYFADIAEYRRQRPQAPFEINWMELDPVLHDAAEAAGQASGHYFHMDLWAARLIHRRRPDYHLDIGSRIDGFIAHLLAFMDDVRIVDVRPLPSHVEGLSSIKADATTLVDFPNDSVDSLSSLHAAEHFGLGRYGDPIDPSADLKFMKSLQRVLRPAGRLYFAVPVGRPRVEFNAHRVYDPGAIVKCFDDLRLLSFSGVNDQGQHVSGRPDDFAGAKMACGLYEFTK